MNKRIRKRADLFVLASTQTVLPLNTSQVTVIKPRKCGLRHPLTVYPKIASYLHKTGLTVLSMQIALPLGPLLIYLLSIHDEKPQLVASKDLKRALS